MISFLNEDYANVCPFPLPALQCVWLLFEFQGWERTYACFLSLPFRISLKSNVCHLSNKGCFTDRLWYRRILTYLIPLRILKGHLPSEELLDRFPVLRDLFIPFISAIQKGDLAAFDGALESHERRLVELSLWLIVEKTRELCMRGLFRRV